MMPPNPGEDYPVKSPARSTAPLVTTDPANAAMRSFAAPVEIAPGVLMHAQFANCYAVKTDAGLLMIDTGVKSGAAGLHAAVRAWSDQPLHSVVFTHGHIDHVFGLKSFLDAGDRPQIIAQENCVARFQRYQLTQGLNQSINRRQFGDETAVFPVDFAWPTVTFRDGLKLRLGKTDVTITAGKGETDDHCFVWLPEQRYLFTGDFIVWRSPNCGNPQKVQRYPVEWVKALEQMAALEPEWLFPGHGQAIHGRDAVRLVLTETAQYLRHIIDQVLTRLNAGETSEQIFHGVTSHPELKKRPYLLEMYDHPKFIVRNLIRQWGGWWNGNAADLFPATPEQQAREIVTLAGGVAPLIARARQALDEGRLEMAAHMAEWATRADAANRDAQAFKRDVYERCMTASNNLMAQGIYRGAMNDASEALGGERVKRQGRVF
jgi:glyoxylase-like metal-dependent hydrolase (beta-lactamase superfamily II)